MIETGVRIQEKGQVTIPYKIRKKLNLKQGDLVVFVETEAGVVIKPAAVVIDDDRRAEVNAIVTSIRERFKDYSVDEIESLVTDAIRDARVKRP
jgi:AbrB family looped-hinge helix DNA binding protein